MVERYQLLMPLAPICTTIMGTVDVFVNSTCISRSMSGSVPLEKTLAARLDLFKPSLPRVHEFLEKRPQRVSHGVNDIVHKL
ncbi:3-PHOSPHOSERINE PHOSPHATASE family protein [Artemisia annua]|uniref:3-PHOSPHOSERINE PHOSPHATASE family protein n=1 Tax=Artemisia annua TaxID=35608 RepID=A0A2U1N7N8_ARTAN|nr:3-PHOSPHOSERINE PHOSPHATASE family protein [Artemisia annua]